MQTLFLLGLFVCSVTAHYPFHQHHQHHHYPRRYYYEQQQRPYHHYHSSESESGELEIGSQCLTKQNEEGICLLFSHCNGAGEAVRRGIHHNFCLPGFHEPVICCPYYPKELPAKYPCESTTKKQTTEDSPKRTTSQRPFWPSTQTPTDTPPSRIPPRIPTDRPTGYPDSGFPKDRPTGHPASGFPTDRPTGHPDSGFPTDRPTGHPDSGFPTDRPTGHPDSGFPTDRPAGHPDSGFPKDRPTGHPASGFPTDRPTGYPDSGFSSEKPSDIPSETPSRFQTEPPSTEETPSVPRPSVPSSSVPISSVPSSSVPPSLVPISSVPSSVPSSLVPSSSVPISSVPSSVPISSVPTSTEDSNAFGQRLTESTPSIFRTTLAVGSIDSTTPITEDRQGENSVGTPRSEPASTSRRSIFDIISSGDLDDYLDTITLPPLPENATISQRRCQEYIQNAPAAPVYIAVVGGTPARPGEYTHMAALGYGEEDNKQWLCGGSLISDQYILTASHCLEAQGVGLVQYVRLGDLDLRSDNDSTRPQDFRVAERIRHPNYTIAARYNDIALLRLDKPAVFDGYVYPSCLPPPELNPLDQNPVATGWGRVEFEGDPSNILLKVTLEWFGDDECRRFYGAGTRRLLQGVNLETQVCAGSRDEEKDTCAGDSGGPLIVDRSGLVRNIVGVTSFGKICGQPGLPAIYTRVLPYVSWIESIVWPEQ